jgi:hypothetical protein
MNYLSRSAVRVIVWSLIGTVVVLSTLFLVAYGQGYRFDFKKGKLVGGGLVLIDSLPSNASIYLDGEKISKKSATRLLLTPGTYSIRLVKNGYRDWGKTINVHSTRVSDLKYPLLIPNNITSRTIKSLDNEVEISESSPNNELVAFFEGGKTKAVRILNTKDDAITELYTFDKTLIQANAELESILWAPDNTHILLKIATNDRYRFILLNTKLTTEVLDLSAYIDSDSSNLLFRPNDWRDLYWKTPKAINKLNLSELKLTNVYDKSVQSFWIVENGLWVIESSKDKTQAFLLNERDVSMASTIDLPASKYTLQYAEYAQARYLLIFDTVQQSLSIYKSEHDNHYRLVRTFHGINQPLLVEGPNKRFILMHMQDQSVTYDFENERFDVFDDIYGPIVSATWYDEYHIVGVVQNTGFIIEFDGANKEDLFSVATSSSLHVAPNKEKIYSWSKAQVGEKFLLQVTQFRN